MALIRNSPQADRVRVLAGVDFRNVGPGWAAKAVQQLEADVKAGAVGVGEISKTLGLSIKKADGTRLHIDDPDLDPVWDACARLGRMLDQMPNLYSEVGAVLYDLGRQPRFAHDFLVKYQNRILFGKDSFQPEEYPYYWRVFETKDEYFDYYRNYHAFWKLYGL